MSHLACKCLELQLIWIYSPPVNKGITYPLSCLPCSSDLLLICSSAIMFTEIGYFGWHREFSDSIEPTAKEIDAHLPSEFLSLLLKKNNHHQNTKNIYRFSENSIPKPLRCMTIGVNVRVNGCYYYGPVTRGGNCSGCTLPLARRHLALALAYLWPCKGLRNWILNCETRLTPSLVIKQERCEVIEQAHRTPHQEQLLLLRFTTITSVHLTWVQHSWGVYFNHFCHYL